MTFSTPDYIVVLNYATSFMQVCFGLAAVIFAVTGACRVAHTRSMDRRMWP